MEQQSDYNGLGPVPPPPRISGGELLSFSGSAGGVVQNEPVSVGTALPTAIFPAVAPFTVLTYKTSNGAYYAGVYYESDLLKNFADSTSGVSITGLLTSANPSPSDSGWHASSTGYKVYLEIATNAYSVTSATIKVDSNYVGGTWITNGDTQNDGGTPASQTFARKLIAEVGDSNVITQKVFNNLGMMNFCINGIPALYPIPI